MTQSETGAISRYFWKGTWKWRQQTQINIIKGNNMTSERCCTLTNISCWQKNKYRYRCGNWSATWGSGTYGAAQAKGWSWHAPSCLECGDAVQGRARCCLRWGGPRFSWWVYSKLVSIHFYWYFWWQYNWPGPPGGFTWSFLFQEPIITI